MRQFFLVPSATMATTPPPGRWHACACPSGAHLVAVDGWNSPSEQDAWEALPGVTELLPWEMVPAAAVPALESLRAIGKAPVSPITAGHTVTQALRALRGVWPAARL